MYVTLYIIIRPLYDCLREYTVKKYGVIKRSFCKKSKILLENE